MDIGAEETLGVPRNTLMTCSTPLELALRRSDSKKSSGACERVLISYDGKYVALALFVQNSPHAARRMHLLKVDATRTCRTPNCRATRFGR